jgi:UDP:flavonoid glycosyltransferase YjiC (YdhE family)
LNESKSKFGLEASIPPTLNISGGRERGGIPPLNVAIQVVGSRGDVQPFIALGRVLKESHNHRVRVATHAVFQKLVEDNGLEFFNIGGDPVVLMAFMVKTPGLFPTMDVIKSGDIGKRQKEMFEILNGCWMSCYQAGNNVATDQKFRKYYDKEFVADAIIANPPSFAHIHCAQKLGIPVHLMFT